MHVGEVKGYESGFGIYTKGSEQSYYDFALGIYTKVSVQFWLERTHTKTMKTWGIKQA